MSNINDTERLKQTIISKFNHIKENVKSAPFKYYSKGNMVYFLEQCIKCISTAEPDEKYISLVDLLLNHFEEGISLNDTQTMLTSISITFADDCYVTIPAEDIEHVAMEQVTKKYIYNDGHFTVLDEAGYALLMLKERANTNIVYTADDQPIQMALFERILSRADVELVTFYYSDGRDEDIFVHWDDCDETNECQEAFATMDDIFVISVDQTATSAHNI